MATTALTGLLAGRTQGSAAQPALRADHDPPLAAVEGGYRAAVAHGNVPPAVVGDAGPFRTSGPGNWLSPPAFVGALAADVLDAVQDVHRRLAAGDGGKAGHGVAQEAGHAEALDLVARDHGGDAGREVQVQPAPGLHDVQPVLEATVAQPGPQPAGTVQAHAGKAGAAGGDPVGIRGMAVLGAGVVLAEPRPHPAFTVGGRRLGSRQQG